MNDDIVHNTIYHKLFFISNRSQVMPQEFLPYRVHGPGFVSISPANISSSFLQGALRREGASSPTVPPSPLPVDMHSEEERRDTDVEVKMIYLG